jgi:hypothetical protein
MVLRTSSDTVAFYDTIQVLGWHTRLSDEDHARFLTSCHNIWFNMNQFQPVAYRSFDKAEPNSQVRRKYIRNNLINKGFTHLQIEWTPD